VLTGVTIVTVICNLIIFALISQSDIVCQRKIIGHCDVYVTNKNNNVSFEGLDIHYHFNIVSQVVLTDSL
jgi:hypothetical protein